MARLPPIWCPGAPLAVIHQAVTCAAAPVVINEVHYDPDNETEPVEFIELLNPGDTPVDLQGFWFSEGVGFGFGESQIIPPGGFLIVAEDAAAVRAEFPTVPVPVPIVEFTGALANDGELLELRDPAGVAVDRVRYRAEFPWPIAPNGEGASMQLIEAGLDNDLGGAWRAGTPTPGLPNATLTTNAPPLIRQVSHQPQVPASGTEATVTATVTDGDGVSSVRVLYQVVPPGGFIPAVLPHDTRTLTRSPDTPHHANPEFEDPANWTPLPMADSAEEPGVFSAVLPAQPNRTLVRYRIEATDTRGSTLRVPYPDDRSLNFAYFVYNGVPDYVSGDETFSAGMLTSLPVYTMITRDSDRTVAFAYESTGNASDQLPKGSVRARQVYNWECALVYDGVVYDHVGWRLRQRNDRYAGNGKRSLRFRMNRGHYFQARDERGEKLPVKWRRFNTSKMSRFGGRNSYGLHETINSQLWRLVGVECPRFFPAHFRLVDGEEEAPDPYNGDFFGLTTVVQDIDGRLLDERGLPDGNIYKLKDGVTDPLELQRNQAGSAVSDGSDFENVMAEMDGSKDEAWLADHVDWHQWSLYHAVVEAVRHYDYGTTSQHLKNRAWYFAPHPTNPLGQLRLIPHDHDATWARGYHDSLNRDGIGVGTGFPWSALFGGISRPPRGVEKEPLALVYRNTLRAFRDLVWTEETVHALIDAHVAKIGAFTLADRARWTGGPDEAGRESMASIDRITDEMKEVAFVSDQMYGTELPGGRAAFLDQIATDPQVPARPTIAYSGSAGFEAGALAFTSSPFSDPQGGPTFGAIEWRLAEVAGLGGAGGGAGVALIASGDAWRYHDSGDDPGTGWEDPGFDDGGWASGRTQIGYGESDQVTTSQSGHATTYFRLAFDVEDPDAFGSLAAGIIRDDGAIVYFNGEEVWRNQMPDGAVDFTTEATASATGDNEKEFQPLDVSVDHLVAGTNVVAVEVHQRPAASGDMSFDFELSAEPAAPVVVPEWVAGWESGAIPTENYRIAPPAKATSPGHTYRARVRHRDTSGRWSHWSEPVEFTATAPDISAYARSLVISEVMYHPAEPSAEERAAGFDDDDAFEFIEIRNTGDQPVDLTDLRFTKGVDIDLSGSIDPGAYVLVVADEAAFDFRYGDGKPVIGRWDGKLDNGGERLKLSFGAGQPVIDFEYSDDPPWATAPDGGGPSLTLVNPLSRSDPARAANWRPSQAGGGSPGSHDGTTFSGENLLGYGVRGGLAVQRLDGGQVALVTQTNSLAGDLWFEVQLSRNLGNWSSVPADTLRGDPTTDGFVETAFVVSPPIPARSVYVRLVVGTGPR